MDVSTGRYYMKKPTSVGTCQYYKIMQLFLALEKGELSDIVVTNNKPPWQKEQGFILKKGKNLLWSKCSTA